MNNLVLAMVVVVAAGAWTRSGYWLPRAMPISVAARHRTLSVLGLLVALTATAYSVGDIVGGRTQIARDPARYATRLVGDAAHHHDTRDAMVFWRQVILQAGVGCAVGVVLIALSRANHQRAELPHRR